jgi:hypothetical protein
MTVAINKTFECVYDGIANMLTAAEADYKTMSFGKNEEMLKAFCEGWVVKEGSKYIKILTKNGSYSWGFVVNTDNDKKFKKGDVLMCAGFKAPARNAARGNVLDGGFLINWTGPLYL